MKNLMTTYTVLHDREELYQKNLRIAIIIPGLFFFVFPLLGCIISIFITFLINQRNYLKITFAYCYFFCVLIQGQRELHPLELGDWGNYLAFYNDASSLYIFETFDGEKDIAFSIWNYIGHKIFESYGNAFLCFTVDIEMLLFGLSAYRIWKYTKTDVRHGLCSLILIYFFPELLLMTNNILRQQFALSLVLWALILKNTESKKWPPFLTFGIFTHSMVLILLPLFFFKINKFITIRNLALLSLSIIIISFMLIFLNTFFLSSSFYLFQRLGSGSILSGDTIDPSVTIPLAILVICVYVKLYLIDHTRNKNIWIGINILLYIIGMCFLTYSMPMFITRIYILRLPIMSIFIPYIFYRKNLLSDVFLILVYIFFIIRYISVGQNEWLNIGILSRTTFSSLIASIIS